MKKITLFLLGMKGYAVAEGVVPFLSRFDFKVVIGRDSGVENDYSDQIKTFCEAYNLEYCYRIDSNESFFSSCDLLVAAGWRWLISEGSFQLIVIHDSLLPKYRGFSPLVNALINREEKIGVTALFGAVEYDSGPIVKQMYITVEYPTTIAKEMSRISVLYSQLINSVLLEYLTSPLRHVEQDNSLSTYSLWRDEDDYRIDWSKSAEDIVHFISCVGFPYKGASSYVDDQLIRVIEVELIEDINIENRQPGKVIKLSNSKPYVVCGQGIVRINNMIDLLGNDFKLSKFRVRFE